MTAELVSVAYAAGSTILPGVPGPLDPSGSGGALAFIQNGYLFALGIAGVLAVGSIVWGGIQYTLSRGNPAQLSDAWDRIIQAFVGILLLVGAGTILTIVNPGLTSLELPDLQTVDEAKYGAGGLYLDPSQVNEDGQPPNNPSSNTTNIPATVSCKSDPSKCTSLSAAGLTCKSRSSCTAHVQVAAAVQCAIKKVNGRAQDFVITEAYPPSQQHLDARHNNGCAVDIRLMPNYAKDCAATKAFAAAINGCQGSALNEYAGVDNFSGIDFKGCAQRTKYWSGNHVHVNGCPRGTI